MSKLVIQCWNIERINLPKTSKYIAEFCHRLQHAHVNILLENKNLPDDVLEKIGETLNKRYLSTDRWEYVTIPMGGAAATLENCLVLYRSAHPVQPQTEALVKAIKASSTLDYYLQPSLDRGVLTSTYRIPALFTVTAGKRAFSVGAMHAPGPGTKVAPTIVGFCLDALGKLKTELVLGDFNCYGTDRVGASPFEPGAYVSLRTTSYQWIGDDKGTTFRRDEGVCTAELSSSPLDRVYVKRSFDRKVGVVYNRDTSIHHYSDHIPVRAEVSLPVALALDVPDRTPHVPERRARVVVAAAGAPPARPPPDLDAIAKLFVPGTVVLNDAAVGTNGLDDLLQGTASVVGASSIALGYSGVAPRPTAKKLVVEEVTWALRPAAGQRSLPATATFWSTESGLAFAVDATVSGTFQLKSLFEKEMAGDALGQASLTSTHLVFTFGEIPEEPLSRFNGKPGLHLSASFPLSPSGPCDWLAPVWGGKLPADSVPLEGSIACYDSGAALTRGLQVDLRGELPPSPALPLVNYSLTGSLRAVFNASLEPPVEGAVPSSGFYLDGALVQPGPAATAAAGPGQIPAFVAWLPSARASGGTYLITLGEAKAPAVTLDELVPLLGGDDWQPELEPVKGWLEGLALNSLSLAVSTGRKLDVTYAAVEVASSAPQDLFKIGSEQLSLSWLALTVAVDAPFSPKRRITFTLLSEVTVGSGRPAVAVELTLPGPVIAGTFQPEATLTLAEMVKQFGGAGAPDLPSDLASLTIDHVVVTVDYAVKQYRFEVFFSLVVLGVEFNGVSCVVNYDAKAGSAPQVELGGTVKVGPLMLAVAGKIDPRGKSHMAIHWRPSNPSETLTLADVLRDVGLGFQLPAGLDFALDEAAFRYTFGEQNPGDRRLTFRAKLTIGGLKATAAAVVLPGQGGGRSQTALLLEIPLPDTLTGIPIVGSTPLPISQLQLVATSGDLSAKLANVNAELAALDAGTVASAGALAGGVTLCAKLAGQADPVVLPISRRPPPANAPAAAVSTEGVDAGRGASGPASVIWKEVQSSVGPLFFNRVGVGWQDNGPALVLDCALLGGGLELALNGFWIAFPLHDPTAFTFGLGGLGIHYANGPVAIGGSFTDRGGDYTGSAMIRMPQFDLTAFGGYKKEDGHPSVFVYGVLHNPPIGGPPFFFVTGVAAGFGYNRQLVRPPLDGVETFPLVTAADSSSGESRSFSEIASDLADVIPPRVGESWVAAGVRFKSFELVTSFALLTVAIGAKTEIALLGKSSVSIPSDVPLLHATVVLDASYSPDEGVLRVNGKLTPGSYVLSPDCHLSGGFAMYAWFKDQPHVTTAGDFVLTVGGYASGFSASQYPVVPRLSLQWRISDQISLTGQQYAALTPSCVMAGASLSLVFRTGGLRAWLDAKADFFMSWKPYRYDIRLSIKVGVSFTFTLDLLFCSVTVTLSASIGAGLHIWGPEFSGDVYIDVGFTTFSIGFGARSSKDPTIPWSEFVSSFLPPDPADACTVRLTSGGVRSVTKGDAAPSWVVNGGQLEIVTHCLVPSTAAAGHPGPAIGVRPVGLPADGSVVSTHVVTISRDGVDCTNDFALDAFRENVPLALWGGPATGADASPVLRDALTGLRITPKPHETPDQTPKVPLEGLLVQGPAATIAAIRWSSVPNPDPAAYDNRDEAHRWSVVRGIASQGRARDMLLAGFAAAGLAVPEHVDLGAFGTNVAGALLDAPLLLNVIGDRSPGGAP